MTKVFALAMKLCGQNLMDQKTLMKNSLVWIYLGTVIIFISFDSIVYKRIWENKWIDINLYV